MMTVVLGDLYVGLLCTGGLAAVSDKAATHGGKCGGGIGCASGGFDSDCSGETKTEMGGKSVIMEQLLNFAQ